MQQIKEQLQKYYGLEVVSCENLNTLANDSFAVTTPEAKFALKIYNPQSRSSQEVTWEMELIEHLIQDGIPVAKPVASGGNYIQNFHWNDNNYATVLYEWAPGKKPSPSLDTYALLGKIAAQIHESADTFTASLAMRMRV
jgi:Ser/Thr protein kinase RdoA (MazF antagonist)